MARNIKMASPFGKCFPFAIKNDVSRNSPIVGLLSLCGPPAVARFVIAIVINAVERVSRGWRSTHVGIESLERRLPFSTHFYSTRSVIFVGDACRGIAPLSHGT